MKIGRLIGRLVALILLVVIGFSAYALLTVRHSGDETATQPTVAGAPAELTTPQARGEYLTRAADCAACHTVPGGQAFAGGVAFKLPMGTIYSTNITADKDTGIGTWSDDEFVRAMHAGVNKEGQPLYPAFPYTSYTALSRDDILAIKAYLFSLPAIHAPARTNELSFPYNQRWAISLWNAAFLKKQRFQPEQGKSEAWNRGAYLATALGHCDECHTPRNAAFALKTGQALAGTELQGWKAYNITPDKDHGIGSWTDQELASYLSKGHAAGRGTASGPMGEVVENSLQYLTPSDISALVAYLREVKPQAGGISVPPAAATGSAPVASTAGLGEQLFVGACAGCHLDSGQGRQTDYASLTGTRSVRDPHATNLTQVILHGSQLHVSGQRIFMPSFGHAYTDAEIAALSNYVVSHFGGQQGTLSAAEVAQRR
ncbi:Cytochrome c, mono-and diheme variants [Dyella sp. OK004]|uniref:c-type cytochrome n=1 Tax=Dyella sp. OK004 TaxID=1855292 RepID=UPI0008F3CAE2|nr:c-type cytochrome [Dyella sp. OK004]SFS14041.1 Cytochrome c, mono-and diheme variants [Dyella sp. OK004]